MKAFIAIAATAILVWALASVYYGGRTAYDRVWMISAIKAPGRMALGSIQADMHAGRFDVARRKIDAFMQTWQRFDSGPDSCSGLGIGDIMLTFSKIQENTNVEPSCPLNESLPIRSETNRPSEEAGSRH